ncbi:MAG: Mov34/MPN/PAD-1 family protein [Alphaproteobacteria bacterium]|nr:Mov34/MPN/PAD-1 family protein [Alphaproteobacteria bacterium]
MDVLTLSATVVAAIFDEVRATWPSEGCGVVTGPPAGVDGQAFVRFDNLADRLHAADSVAHPRDARTAYVMHPLQLQRLVDRVQGAGEALLAVVHSHPQHPSYLSATDRAAAAPFGPPTFPDAAQVVVSVYDAEVRDVKAWRWDGQDWQEVAISGLPELPGPPPGARPLGEV